MSSQLKRYEPARLDTGDLLTVHSEAHVKQVAATRGRSVALDQDTHACPESYETALLAAGSAVLLTQKVVGGQLDAGFSIARPPGHHAGTNRAMGFCLFNNIAAAAAWALAKGGLSRVAIVDFDVHHGNGTQEIFYSRNDVLYVSNHQSPFYPGTGTAGERGQGAGQGFTLNLPLAAGVDDAFVLNAYLELVLPALRTYEPELILVSAGFDAHRRDPLGGLRMTGAGFGVLASLLIAVADEMCGGRVSFVLEGGYSLEGLASGVLNVLGAALQPSQLSEAPPAPATFSVYRRQLEKAWAR